MREKANPFDIFQCDTILNAFGVSVAPEFQGYSLGYAMASCFQTMAKYFHLPAVNVPVSSPIVQKICESLGYRTYAEFVYSKHKNSAGKLIIPLEDTPSFKSMGMKF